MNQQLEKKKMGGLVLALHPGDEVIIGDPTDPIGRVAVAYSTSKFTTQSKLVFDFPRHIPVNRSALAEKKRAELIETNDRKVADYSSLEGQTAVKEAMIDSIKAHLSNNNIRQVDLCRVLGISQSRCSRLLAYYCDDFSLETLISYLASLGRKVALVVEEGDETVVKFQITAKKKVPSPTTAPSHTSRG